MSKVHDDALYEDYYDYLGNIFQQQSRHIASQKVCNDKICNTLKTKYIRIVQILTPSIFLDT